MLQLLPMFSLVLMGTGPVQTLQAARAALQRQLTAGQCWWLTVREAVVAQGRSRRVALVAVGNCAHLVSSLAAGS